MCEKVFLTAFLLSAVYITDCTIYRPVDIIICDPGNKTIPWNYTEPDDMLSVLWHFINSTNTTLIMVQGHGSNATIYNGFNIEHISNGAVKLVSPTTANTGTYRITVTYSTSAPTDVDEVMVGVYKKPYGLGFKKSTSGDTGKNTIITCTASYLGDPEATLYIMVDGKEYSNTTNATVTENNEVKCCLKNGAAICLSETERCITAQHKPKSNIVLVILPSIAVGLKAVLIIVLITMIFVGRLGKVVVWILSGADIAVTIVDCVVALYSLIAGAVSVALSVGENKYCDTDASCTPSFRLGIASIVLAVVDVVVLVVFIRNRKGGFGERFTCLNKVLPVCKDTEQRGPPDGKPDNHAAKEKQREIKLQHKEQTQQHHKETDVHKGKPNKEKHEEPPKGRPLPQPSGNNRPMPDIPSDRHKRGLSANFHDDRDTPLDDNILHTLPVAKKPKNALDPMNTEGQSKNADDQPKKKKKKKKDRDTRSDDIEDNIDSHGKVLAF